MSTGAYSSCGLHSGAGGDGPRVTGLCAVGVCGLLGGVGVSWGAGLCAVGVWGMPGVKGGGSRGVEPSVAGVCGFLGGGGILVAGPGAVRVGRVWAIRWGLGRVGQGLWSGVRVWCVDARVRSRRCACVVSCRSGGLAVEFAVHRGCGEDFVDACAHLVSPLVGGGERVLYGWVEVYAPEDSLDGVVAAGEGLLWLGGGGPSVCWGLLQFVCGSWGWPRSRAWLPWLASAA